MCGRAPGQRAGTVPLGTSATAGGNREDAATAEEEERGRIKGADWAEGGVVCKTRLGGVEKDAKGQRQATLPQITSMMGNPPMSAGEHPAALKQKGWTPDAPDARDSTS